MQVNGEVKLIEKIIKKMLFSKYSKYSLKKWEDLEKVKILGADLKLLGKELGSNNVDIVMGKFSFQEGLYPHYHKFPTEEIYYIIEGKVGIFIDNKMVKAEKGDFFYIPPGTLHYPINENIEPCWILFILSPPEDEAVVVDEKK